MFLEIQSVVHIYTYNFHTVRVYLYDINGLETVFFICIKY